MFKLLLISLLCAGVVMVEAEVSKNNANTTVEMSTKLPGLLEAHGRVVTCFVSVEAIVRARQFSVACHLCSHIVYTGLLIDPVTAKLRPRSGFSPDLKKLRKICPHIKLSLSVHQENGSSAFSSISTSDSLRREFANSVYGYVRDYEYDGVDLNLNLDNATEFAMTTNKSNIMLIVKDLRAALDVDHILTASLSKDAAIIDAAYDIPAFAEQLQYLHIRSFDYHGAEDGFTGPAAPLRSRDNHSVVATMEHLKGLGAPVSKLVLGVPFFGRTFLLKEPASSQNFGSAVEAAGMKGPFTNTTGFIAFNEACLELKNNGDSWDISWDTLSRTPYAQSGAQWMSYEDERSVQEKVRYAVREGLAGVAVWTLDLDDTRGQCSSSPAKRFTLLEGIHTAMTLAVTEGDISDPYEEASSESSDWIFPLSLAVALIACLVLAVAVLCLKYSIPINCPDAGMV